MAAPKHRVTMGGQPTIPQAMGSMVMAFAVISALPPALQREAFAMYVGQVLVIAVAVQSRFTPRPVV